MAGESRDNPTKLGPNILTLRGGKAGFGAAAGLDMMTFLVMLRNRYEAAAAHWRGTSGAVAGSIRSGMVRRFESLRDAAGVFIEDAGAPWSRVEWLRAAAEIDAAAQTGLPLTPDPLPPAPPQPTPNRRKGK